MMRGKGKIKVGADAVIAIFDPLRVSLTILHSRIRRSIPRA
jgi:hypothetical protein